jgi:hypothetical protein
LPPSFQVKSNLKIVTRERGKIVARREGHNIWLNLGREFLAQLIAYTSFLPLTPERDDGVRYMGLGIGGNRQLALTTANAAPLAAAYPGTNAQNDTTASVLRLERPVRVSGATDVPPYSDPSNVWLGQVQAPATHPVATQTTFKRVFTDAEVSYGTFLTVPLSEIALFTNAADPALYNNTAIAYDTFDTLSKTGAFSLEIDWTIRF